MGDKLRLDEVIDAWHDQSGPTNEDRRWQGFPVYDDFAEIMAQHKLTTYYDDGEGRVGFLISGQFAWYEYKPEAKGYVQVGSTSTPEGAQKRRLDHIPSPGEKQELREEKDTTHWDDKAGEDLDAAKDLIDKFCGRLVTTMDSVRKSKWAEDVPKLEKIEKKALEVKKELKDEFGW